MPRVLLVDDDPAMLRLLEVNFRLEGFETVTATRGEEAVDAVRADPPDAVVLDVMLPGMDGHEVVRTIRDEPAAATLPVVFLTGRSTDDDPRFEGPGIAVLGKPFDPQELVALVRAGIGAPA
jgi:DNA-binding response OmpR family regulator